MGIIYKSKREIERIRKAGRLVAEILRELSRQIRPGVTTAELCSAADAMIAAGGAEPVFPAEAGFPASICTSVNEEVVHGVPGPRKLRNGDIISIDVGVRLDGYIGDGAATFPVGEVDEESKRLMHVTKECLRRAIEVLKPGVDLVEVSRAIQECAQSHGFSVVRDFVGHGVGEHLHEAPQVPNFVGPGGARPGTECKPGMVLAIEPMVNLGTWKVTKLPDGWTVATKDGRRSAHFEHTVAVVENGVEVLTEL